MKTEGIEIEVTTKGTEKLQDLADVIAEISDRIVIRNNEVVNVNINTTIDARAAQE